MTPHPDPETTDETDLETPLQTDGRKKLPKQQLSKGMEHIRSIVTLPEREQDPGAEAYGVPATYLPLRKPATDSTLNPHKRTDPFQFGSRFLEEGDDIFSHNAWDHVETDETYQVFIEAQAAKQRASPVPETDKIRFDTHPEKWWDKFYGNNKANFFKDRKWLVQEFPVLEKVTREGYGRVKIVEIGAGAGNTAFPILKINANPHLSIHACDYSKKAVQLMRQSPLYDERYMRADVWDVAGTAPPPDVEPATVDIAIMIFVFSALSPSQWTRALRNVWKLLKPGGIVLFRDYGRGDLAQVRFKTGRYLEENFYIRGDGTRVYFFGEKELEMIWSGRMTTHSADLNVDHIADQLAHTEMSTTTDEQPFRPAFEIVNLGVDRRMLVNRQRKLKMYRCWMQGLFRKPADP